MLSASILQETSRHNIGHQIEAQAFAEMSVSVKLETMTV